MKVSSQQISSLGWRIFVETPDKVKFSATIKCPHEPPAELILNIWNQAKKQFFIEVEGIEQKPIKKDALVVYKGKKRGKPKPKRRGRRILFRV